MAKHPKPDFRGKEKPPYGPWMEWAERMLEGAIGSAASLSAAIAAAVNAIDLSAITAELADHETRIGDLESATVPAKTTSYSQAYGSVGTTLNTTYYWMPYGDAATAPGTVIAVAQHLWGRAGTIKNLRFISRSPNGDNDTATLTLNINGADTALTVTISGNVSTMVSDTAHSVPVSVGDLVCFAQKVGANTINGNSRPCLCFDFEEA